MKFTATCRATPAGDRSNHLAQRLLGRSACGRPGQGWQLTHIHALPLPYRKHRHRQARRRWWAPTAELPPSVPRAPARQQRISIPGTEGTRGGSSVNVSDTAPLTTRGDCQPGFRQPGQPTTQSSSFAGTTTGGSAPLRQRIGHPRDPLVQPLAWETTTSQVCRWPKQAGVTASAGSCQRHESRWWGSKFARH